MADRSLCPVCRETVMEVVGDQSKDRYPVLCDRCGRFEITRTVAAMLECEDATTTSGRESLGAAGSRRRANASGWLRERAGTGFCIGSKMFERLMDIPTPSVLDRTERLLKAIELESEDTGMVVNVGDLGWQARAWAKDRDELRHLGILLQELGYVEVELETSGPSGWQSIRITAGGWKYLDDLRRAGVDSPQGFVAMWFDPTMAQVYDEAFDPAIRQAGYRPHRVDRREYSGKIDDEVVAQIRRSRFVVADLSGQRGGVYWEAGFAKGLGREVFLTCREDFFADLHFDINHYNCIKWGTPAELLSRLRLRIEAVLGPGPLA